MGGFTTPNADTLTEISKKRSGVDRLTTLKLNLNKAYEKLSWNAIEAVLRKMRFSHQWIQIIIMPCARTI